jgi:hypothetical protein
MDEASVDTRGGFAGASWSPHATFEVAYFGIIQGAHTSPSATAIGSRLKLFAAEAISKTARGDEIADSSCCMRSFL